MTHDTADPQTVLESTPEGPLKDAPEEDRAFEGTLSPPGFRFDSHWLTLIPALIVILVYLPALRFQFVWDDNIFLRDLPNYRLPDLWLPSLFQPFVLSPNYFRPLALLTFVAELRLGGLNPLIFHATNLLLHAINTTLVVLLAWRLIASPARLLQRTLALLAGLLYGLHPALIEGVAFISSRFDLLVTLFLLLALLADCSIESRRGRPVLVGMAFLLAALSKEMALAFVAALPFWHLGLAAKDRRSTDDSSGKHWRGFLYTHGAVYLSIMVASLVYLGIRYAALKYLLVSQTMASQVIGNLLQHFLLFIKTLGEALVLVLWPFSSLTPIHYSALPVPLGDASAWLGLVWVGLIVTALAALIRRQPRPGWLALGGVLALSPVLNLFPLELGGGAFIAERFLLFPLAFFALAVVVLVQEVLSSTTIPVQPETRNTQVITRRMIYVLPVLWLVFSLGVIQLSLPNWRDNLSLWLWAARRAPLSATPPTNLSLEYIDLGQYPTALAYARQAIGLDPKNADAWNNQGLAFLYLGEYSEAQSAFEQAVSLQPKNALYWNNLAGALREQGQLAEAEKILLDNALALNPNLPYIHLNLGIVYLRADRPDLASQHLEIATQLLPPEQAADTQALLEQAREPERWLKLGDLLLQHNEFEGAARAFDQAAVFGAPMADSAAGFSAALIALKDWDNAQHVLEQAIQGAPQDARLYFNLGVVMREQGELDVAKELFAKAVELAPTWELPQEALAELD